MRRGAVLRILPHGTITVWDEEGRRSYPFYGEERFALNEPVLFETDETDTIVRVLVRERETEDGKGQ